MRKYLPRSTLLRAGRSQKGVDLTDVALDLLLVLIVRHNLFWSPTTKEKGNLIISTAPKLTTWTIHLRGDFKRNKSKKERNIFDLQTKEKH